MSLKLIAASLLSRSFVCNYNRGPQAGTIRGYPSYRMDVLKANEARPETPKINWHLARCSPELGPETRRVLAHALLKPFNLRLNHRANKQMKLQRATTLGEIHPWFCFFPSSTSS